jgi:hypothetical protein
MPIISALRILRQKDCKLKINLGYNSNFETSLGYLVETMSQNKQVNAQNEVSL